jgi:hypothetical protein
MDEQERAARAARIERLIDAIELVKEDQREDALPILRDLISEDGDFEDAWLWMSVAVDNIDQSLVCLDNVLRINPHNNNATLAIYRLRKAEIIKEARQARLRSYRDLTQLTLWILIMGLLFAIFLTTWGELNAVASL